MNVKDLTISKKVRLMEGIYVLDIVMPETLPFIPGQFVVLMVQPKVFRSYSIVAVEENVMTLLIDVRVGGPASKFFEACELGDALQLVGKALGRFVLHDHGKPLVFIATGTGLAPFVPMVRSTLDENPDARIQLFFGVRHVKDNYCPSFFKEYLERKKYPNFQMFHCISRPETDLGDDHYEGRVTDVVPKQLKECGSQDFYLCGNPQMVDDIQKLLAEKGATDNVHMEKYG